MAEKSIKECCLCGDIGFSSDLRLCPKCGFRLQHIYCSSSYPNTDMNTWLCEWCLHDHEKKREPNKRGKPLDFLLEIAQSLPDQEPANGSEEKKTRRRKEDERRSRSTSNPKKHKPNDRWRKPTCSNSSSSPRGGIGRRYKLLADVLC
ncbi:hypothetical protein CKAN_02514700 [Cinnamomum micranthum f. kanehirae]|uniref:PHD-type zinc finger plants domain-containing protein n=1 Tax=Cinnamomum micranthum f. kanehirae TaxID=337451 RepID=A0A3S3N4I1_9MAGN|nr:hypothetical protein CKAN_02514700 [Cinnamomum micranthum f. kanehirae]